MEGLCSATTKILLSLTSRTSLLLRKKQYSSWVYSKYLLCSETKNLWTQVRTWKLELVWRKGKKKKEVQVFHQQRFWELVRVKIKWTEGSNKKINKYTNKAPRIRVLLFTNTFSHQCNAGLEKHFLELQHTDKFPNSPLGLIVIIMHIHHLLSTDMLFYF